jgi:TolB protein
MDAEGLNVRRISWSGSYNESAAWSPTGDRMAYVSRIDGRFEIMVLDLSSGDRVTRLTWGDGNNENPSFSPDGRHLVFSSDRSGRYDIYTMRVNGENVKRLTRNGDCYTPDWSR